MSELYLNTPLIDPTAFVASTATLHGSITVASHVVILFGTVIRAEMAEVHVGAESNIQDNCVVHVDEDFPVHIGRRVTVGHAAVVHGATVGDHCLVGIGSLALNGSVMGEGSWLAAGSVLTEGKTIPPWTIAMGTPAKPVRDITEEEVVYQRDGVDHYLRLGAAYARLLDH
jgi:carbonic anhydrase/acetyltransferase-like protein (isoleucine patch superfamily)